VKPDERALLKAVATRGVRDVRDVIPPDMPAKRVEYLLMKKWPAKGWYSYGVVYDLGWLTPAGLEAAADA
jgi:hypothetical protein